MDAIWLLVIVACPLMMALIMYFMMRGMRGHGGGRDERATRLSDDEGAGG